MRPMVLAMAVWIGVFAAGARGQMLSARMTLADEGPWYAGTPVELRLRVEGTRSAEAPVLPEIEGCEVAVLGGRDISQTMIVEVNGRREDRSTVAYEFRYRLTPTRAGRVRVPPVRVVVGTRDVVAEALEFDVSEARESSGDVRLEVRVDDETPYVGQAVRGSLTWYVGSALRGYEITPIRAAGAEISFPSRVIPGSGEQHGRLVVAGQEAQAIVRTAVVDGRTVQAIEIPFILIPRKAGGVEIEPVTVVYDRVVGERARGFADSPFDDRRITRREATRTGALGLVVSALPGGAPEGFGGLVGEFRPGASVNVREVGVGDPIELTYRVSGKEPMSHVRPPELESIAAFAGGFKMSSEGWRVVSSPVVEERIFTTTIRALSEDVREVPSIPLVFFHPTAETYRVARTPAISLRVKPTRHVTAADAIGGGVPETARGMPRASLGVGEGGIRANFEEGERMLVAYDPGLAWAGTPAGAAGLAGPPVIAGAIALWGAVRRRGSREGAVRRRAMRRGRRRLARAGRADRPGVEACAALIEAVATAEGRRAESATAEECVRAAGAHGAGLAAILARGEATRFDGAPDDPGLVEAARRWLRAFEGERA